MGWSWPERSRLLGGSLGPAVAILIAGLIVIPMIGVDYMRPVSGTISRVIQPGRSTY